MNLFIILLDQCKDIYEKNTAILIIQQTKVLKLLKRGKKRLPNTGLIKITCKMYLGFNLFHKVKSRK